MIKKPLIGCLALICQFACIKQEIPPSFPENSAVERARVQFESIYANQEKNIINS
jgi:hypothetical protein